MPQIDLWRKVLDNERAWSGTDGVHKMGWLRPDDIVHLIEEYHGWYRIDYENSETVDLDPPSSSYPEHWVKDRPDGQPMPLFGPTRIPAPKLSFLDRIFIGFFELVEKILSLFGY